MFFLRLLGIHRGIQPAWLRKEKGLVSGQPRNQLGIKVEGADHLLVLFPH